MVHAYSCNKQMRTVVRVSETVLLTYILTQILPEDHIRKMRALMKKPENHQRRRGRKNVREHWQSWRFNLPGFTHFFGACAHFIRAANGSLDKWRDCRKL